MSELSRSNIKMMDRSEKHGAGGWNLEQALEHIRHWLPSQAPIKNFIHHNTLHAFQHKPFHDAIAEAATIYGAKRYLPLQWYQSEYRRGNISDTALKRVARAHGVAESQQAGWIKDLIATRGEPECPPGIAHSGLRALRRERDHLNLSQLVQPMLFRLLSCYLDQGVSIWRMPHASLSFWKAVGTLVAESSLPLPPLSDPECRRLLALTPEAALEECLRRLVGSEERYEAYLLETCLEHPGWSGMVAVLEETPGSLLAARRVKLVEMLAVELVAELGWSLREKGEEFSPISATEAPRWGSTTETAENQAVIEKMRMWQEALEWTCYESTIALLEKGKAGLSLPNAPARFHAVFCIDDRECSLRRHLEEIEPAVQTFATAGFFGIDFLFQPATSAHAFQFCPIVLKPIHVVREVATTEVRPETPRLRDLVHLAPASNTLFRGWLLTQYVGILSLVRLALNIFSPSSKLLAGKSLASVKFPTTLELFRKGEERTESGHWVGYSLDEMADRVANVLLGMGIKGSFPKLVLMIAHGSSSANNPHFAAYDCGACSGKPGAPNARAFAVMANHPEVRQRLATRGLEIPPDTYVQGAMHDTTRDEIIYFDRELLPTSHVALFEEFASKMAKALARNAQERCLRFEMIPQGLSPAAALKHVQDRATSIFEPRPELNHANNALCVVGRRELTRGLNFGRRPFLNSYDPQTDPTGKILEGILRAVVPVCGGINLEYYFSRVDNEVYGAGTKLPHNVVSLVGVANGVEGDLRTGLPSQMIELHDPVRLLIIVEQETALVSEVLKRDPAIEEWIKNDWVKIACFTPSEKKTSFYESGKWVAVGDTPSASDANIYFDYTKTIKKGAK